MNCSPFVSLCGSVIALIALLPQPAVAHCQECSPGSGQNCCQDCMIPIDSLVAGLYEAYAYQPIPEDIVENMLGRSYKTGCPVAITDLAYLRVTHYDMQGQICLGELVVHQKIARAVMEVFEELFANGFPIERMQLIDAYEANDDLSMENNNTCAFNFRDIVNKPGFVSKHGLGLAIDVNPLWNPYVKGDMILPPSGSKYVDRTLDQPGLIQADGMVVNAFKKQGFTWGGDWMPIKGYIDLQHFEMDPSTLTTKF